VTPPLADLLSQTLAADHPRIVALAASIREREKGGRPVTREKALLDELVERSRKRHRARLASIPTPRFPDDLPIAHAQDRSPVDDHAAARGGDVVVRLAGVRTGERPVGDHEVARLDQQLDTKLHVGERPLRGLPKDLLLRPDVRSDGVR